MFIDHMLLRSVAMMCMFALLCLLDEVLSAAVGQRPMRFARHLWRPCGIRPAKTFELRLLTRRGSAGVVRRRIAGYAERGHAEAVFATGRPRRPPEGGCASGPCLDHTTLIAHE
jgi:hypothetical protein